MSCVTCHMSCVMCHMSRVMCHMSQFFFFDYVVKLIGLLSTGPTPSSLLEMRWFDDAAVGDLVIDNENKTNKKLFFSSFFL